MIGYLEGKVLARDEEKILLLAGHVGYEVLLPSFVMETLGGRLGEDSLSFYIYYYQTERQPKPVLIGFNNEIEKEFFQHFISVEAIGPMKAVKALTQPVGTIAKYIEEKDAKSLSGLKGVGKRTAQKIIATLEGKVGKFALMKDGDLPAAPVVSEDLEEQVLEVLTTQLGYRLQDAKALIAEALERNGDISTPEQLFEEVYRGVRL